MKKVRLGMIGCGLCATTMHAPALAQLSDQFEVVNVSSRNAVRAEKFADIVGAKRFVTDYRDLLDDKEVEAVTITYPFEVQADIVRATLDAGKHVLIEKPIAPTMETARKMVDWEKNSSQVTMIAENFRYRMAMMEAERHIKEGSIGDVRSMLYTCYGNMDRNGMWLKDSKWRWNSIGGVMLDRDVHYTAVMRMLCGEARAAIGRWDRMRDDVGPMDTVSLHVLFESGAVGSLFDYASVTKLNRREIVVIGTTGTIVLDEQCTRFSVCNENGLHLESRYPTDRAESVRREFEDYYSAIVYGTVPRSTFLDGYRDLQLALTPLATQDNWEAIGLIR